MRRLLGATFICLFIGGCTNIAYYAQAVEGHLRIMAATRRISEVILDTATEPGLRQKLEQVSAVRTFASRELGLPNNNSYLSYADLGRPFVVWNVFSAPEFSVEPQKWCLLFVGCVNYRGYYDKQEAELYAEELRQAGADTYVVGIPAYSTLGYFNDPVLNTFLRLGEQESTRIIFHELAHQLVYADGDSAFNESFATAVENEGMRRWLTQTAEPNRLSAFEAHQERRDQFRRLVALCRARLNDIYESSLAIEAKRSAKIAVFAEMQQAYADLKMSWGGYAGFDPWFRQPVNNATLASVTLYTQWVPAFNTLLQQEGGNLPNFYRRVEALARLPKTERSAALNQLLRGYAEPVQARH